MAKIDAAFQAAPNLGGTNYDPIAFARRNRMEKFQIQRQQQEEQAKNTARGLENLMTDVKGWEDQEGFKEIMADQDRVMNGFLDLSRKGLNLVSPKTTQEVMAYKAINDAHAQIKQKVDVWQQQKSIYDLYQKAIEQDSVLPPDEQKIDRTATMNNIQKVLKSKSILSRGNDLQNLVVTKPEKGDVHQYVKDNIGMITKPQKIQMPYTDPDTGQLGSQMQEVVTPEIQKQQVVDYRNLYRTAPPKIKEGVIQARKQDPDNDPKMTDEDYFITMYNQKFKEQMINKKAGTGSGFDITLFGTQKVKDMPPAIKNPNPIPLGERTYNEHYDFNITKPFIGISMSSLGADVYQGNKWEPASKEGGLINAQLNFYDPKTDSFIFTSASNGMDAGVFKQQTFSVPRSHLGKEVDNLPIKLDNGKVGKLKDIYDQTPIGAKTLPLPTNFWSKPSKPYIPKSK